MYHTPKPTIRLKIYEIGKFEISMRKLICNLHSYQRFSSGDNKDFMREKITQGISFIKFCSFLQEEFRKIFLFLLFGVIYRHYKQHVCLSGISFSGTADITGLLTRLLKRRKLPEKGRLTCGAHLKKQPGGFV